MQIEKYTDRLKTLVQAAQSLALRNGHQQLTPLHLLKVLLDDEERLAVNLVEATGSPAPRGPGASGRGTETPKACGRWGARAPAKSTPRRSPPACSTRPSNCRR